VLTPAAPDLEFPLLSIQPAQVVDAWRSLRGRVREAA